MFPELTTRTSTIRSILLDPVQSLLSIGPGTALTMSLLLLGSLVTISLLTRGKRGLGWKSICLIGRFLTLVGLMVVTVFQEVSAQNEAPSDWDAD